MKELVRLKVYLPDDFEPSKLSKGSINNYGRGRTVDRNEKYHKRLAKDLREILKKKYPDLKPGIGAYYVNLRLVIQRENGQYTDVKKNKTKHFRGYCIKAPDIDKAKRCVQDIFEGVIYKNDSMVAGGSEWKLYSDEQTHLLIEVGLLEQTENDLKEQEIYWDELKTQRIK